MAKNLNKLGVKKKSYFMWHKNSVLNINPEILISKEDVCYHVENCEYCKNACIEYYPAYTLNELLQLLPPCIELTSTDIWFIYFGFHYGWCAGYVDREEQGSYLTQPIECQKDSLTDAAAQLLIWCIENDHVKIEDINKK